MAGIYIHIPFCRKACHYCDFHFSTSLALREDMVRSILAEIDLRKEQWSHLEMETLYFGGGTPSVLPLEDLETIISHVDARFKWRAAREVTLEANPDDCTIENLKGWKSLGINRLSIGVQSFSEHDLQWMNRSHNSIQAHQAIEQAANAGFEHLNLDLIYGIPQASDEVWKANVQKAFALPVDHISAYSLTVEENTALHHFVKNKKTPPVDDEKAVMEFEFLQHEIARNGWEHYEISNYCKPGQYAVHNTNYWKQQPYLGIGPSAHSFDGKTRRWNLANNPNYIKKVSAGEVFWEEELLSQTDRVNEAIMLGLRTKWGLDPGKLQKQYGVDLLSVRKEEIEHYKELGLLVKENTTLILSDTGKSYADHIASDLFLS